MKTPELLNDANGRLQSLDVMRGFIMILLAAESCLLYNNLDALRFSGIGGAVVQQFFHEPWHGLRFWDLVQPAFMTMAGAALYISWFRKSQKGVTWSSNFRHVAIRCFKLLLFGVGLHCVYSGQLVWELWNVLSQLAVTTIIAYLIIQRSALFQILVSVFLLVLTELLYRMTNIPGFADPFISGSNFGNWMDLVLMGKVNSDGWVAINFIPTAAHTIWGVLAGKLLISQQSVVVKARTLFIAGIVGLVLGFTLDLTSITPIIKRISTSSFVLASGGWVMLILLFLYWLIDIRKWNRYAWIFVVMGMNAIFIYIFFETVGHQWLNGTIGIFVNGVLQPIGVAASWAAVCTSLVTLFFEWYLCYWLYKRKIFFKL